MCDLWWAQATLHRYDAVPLFLLFLFFKLLVKLNLAILSLATEAK